MQHESPLIARRYEPIATLGSGGMGEVYLAEDRELLRQVALKLPKKYLVDDEAALARFRTEAIAAASISHPNVVRVFDAGEDPTGLPYIAMEYVPGGTLADLLAREGRLWPRAAARIAEGVALALAAAHAKGIIHRDVKPQNILLDENATPKVTDFGIARAGDAAALTRTSTVMGTARYFSPEQAQGNPATQSSDLYSLGVVLYEMIAGRPPFEADSPVGVAVKHATEAPVPPRAYAPRTPPALEAATMLLLTKDPAGRPASALEAADLLAAAAAAHPGRTTPETPPVASRPRPESARRRRRGLAGAGLLAAALLAGGWTLAYPDLLAAAGPFAAPPPLETVRTPATGDSGPTALLAPSAPEPEKRPTPAPPPRPAPPPDEAERPRPAATPAPRPAPAPRASEPASPPPRTPAPEPEQSPPQPQGPVLAPAPAPEPAPAPAPEPSAPVVVEPAPSVAEEPSPAPQPRRPDGLERPVQPAPRSPEPPRIRPPEMDPPDPPRVEVPQLPSETPGKRR